MSRDSDRCPRPVIANVRARKTADYRPRNRSSELGFAYSSYWIFGKGRQQARARSAFLAIVKSTVEIILAIILERNTARSHATMSNGISTACYRNTARFSCLPIWRFETTVNPPVLSVFVALNRQTSRAYFRVRRRHCVPSIRLNTFVTIL